MEGAGDDSFTLSNTRREIKLFFGQPAAWISLA